ncbi:MAG: aldehyde dehydrogenase family protein [Methanomassiliicoccaceae archaeon]|nr:aldehyde dehydrogenase family protein [Methanomassiliicoccaceae archaeon]
MDVYNPARNEKIGEVKEFTGEEVASTIEGLAAGFPGWSAMRPASRGMVLYRAAEIMRADTDRLSSILTAEQGKPRAEARNEILGAAAVFEFYASIAGTVGGSTAPKSDYGYAFTSKSPLGVCGAIIPWNMPALIMAWKVGPAVVTGNTIVVKPAETTPFTNTEMAKILYSAGIPEDVLAVVTGGGETTGAAIVGNKDIRHLSFTGSVETGGKISRMVDAGRVRLTLELGGSDPMIVCGDADLDRAVAGAVAGRFYNCGQICTAVKRLFVADSVADGFTERLKAATERLRVGDGAVEGTDIGPLNSSEGLHRIERMVEDSTGSAKVITGARRPEGRGNFYAPTLITDLEPDSRLLTEEVFGPVLPIVRFGDLDEAIEMANSTRFGLGASIWTNDMRNASKAVDGVKSGILWVNRHSRIPPEVPFGGVKGSGIGRENGQNALDGYLVEKTVIISP